MDRSVWHKEYETGNSLIDLQHRQLFDKIASCIEASRNNEPHETLLLRLQDIQLCLIDHFKCEEGLMPDDERGTLSHKTKHAYVAGKLQDEVARYRARSKGWNTVQGILYNLVEWFADHMDSPEERWGIERPRAY